MSLILFTSFLAGSLAILSPCVLPIAPILLTSAWQEHKWGPIALMLGLSVTFSSLGIIFATTGTLAGISLDTVRHILAILMVICGAFMVSETWHTKLIAALTPITQRFQTVGHHFNKPGLGGQLLLGMIMGGAWLPCVGPTLGLAFSLAAQSQTFGDNLILKSIWIMLFYSLGVCTPLIGISYLSRIYLLKSHLLKLGKIGKMIMGALLFLVGLNILTGWDILLGAWLVKHSPAWMLEWATKY